MVVWPFFVLWAVHADALGWLLAGTAVILSIRLGVACVSTRPEIRRGRYLALGGLALVAVAALLDETAWILWYPVMVSLSLLVVFGASLWEEQTVVERLARLGFRNKPFPLEAVRYTRRVTQVWCGFFVVNGSIAVGTICWGDLQLWALWNGCLSYIAIGTLMGAEYLYRGGTACLRGRLSRGSRAQRTISLPERTMGDLSRVVTSRAMCFVPPER